VFSIVLLLAIVVMFDVNEKLDSFIKAPLKATIFDYFLNFLPYFANQFSPLFTFIAVIFFTSKLAGNSEIIAMLSTGMSFKRLLRPYLMSAAIIAALTFVLSAYVINIRCSPAPLLKLVVPIRFYNLPSIILESHFCRALPLKPACRQSGWLIFQ